MKIHRISAAMFSATPLTQASTFSQTAPDTVSFVVFENLEVSVYGNAEVKKDFKRNDYDIFFEDVFEFQLGG